MSSAILGRSRRGRNPIVVEDRIAGWVFIAPAMILFILFLFGPVLFAFFISLHKWELVRPGRTWVGLDNYSDILSNNDFWIAFRNTTWYAAGVVPAQTITGLVLAVLANRKIRGKTFFRTAFYFPSISSSVVISIIFLWMYSRRGLVDYLLEAIGLPIPQPVWLANPKGVIEMALNNIGIDNVSSWLAGPSFALLAIMMLNVWTTTGTMMVIFLAGLQDVPNDVYEAASLDGASRYRMFRDITIPLLKPVTAFVVTVGLIGTFQVFDQIWVMSSGGPQKTTTTLAYMIYTEAFQFGNGFGYGSAIAVILFFVILALYFVQKRITGDSGPR
jgi:multiple sugar transport system permease protein